jgi:hypothetical protein
MRARLERGCGIGQRMARTGQGSSPAALSYPALHGCNAQVGRWCPDDRNARSTGRSIRWCPDDRNARSTRTRKLSWRCVTCMHRHAGRRSGCVSYPAAADGRRALLRRRPPCLRRRSRSTSSFFFRSSASFLFCSISWTGAEAQRCQVIASASQIGHTGA